MGFFGAFVSSDGRWSEQSTARQWLSIDIHDSDFATVEYKSSRPHTGRFPGFEPRHYLNDATASDPADLNGELEGFVEWARSVLGVQLRISDIRDLVADPDGTDPVNVFIDETVVQLIELLKLPIPADLQPVQ